MDTADKVIWLLLIGMLLLGFIAWRMEPQQLAPVTENFADGSIGGISLTELSTQALDSAPTTSEVKQHYKNLLLFADADIRKQGTAGLRILADFRDRLFSQRDFRDDLTVEDFLANWPDWIPAIDTTIQEPIPSVDDAVGAELKMLAYLQKYYPQEDSVDEQTGSTVRNLIEDFGYRFVFKRGEEVVQLKPDFMTVSLVKNWVNPAARA
jgi:hypothetical protein